MSRPRFPAILTGLVLVFFHAPLVVLILNSFNASRFGGSWEGFTWKWYDLLWKNAPIWKAFLISLKIAAAATESISVRDVLASRPASRRVFEAEIVVMRSSIKYIGACVNREINSANFLEFSLLALSLPER